MGVVVRVVGEGWGQHWDKNWARKFCFLSESKEWVLSKEFACIDPRQGLRTK
jgi:hypothetical protein